MKGFEDFYEVSPMGRVRSLQRTIIDSLGRRMTRQAQELSTYVKDAGYIAVTLYKQGKRTSKYVHRLVAEVYVLNDDPETKILVKHRNGDIADNRANNLYWDKQSEAADYIKYSCHSKRHYGNRLDPSTLDIYISDILNGYISVSEAAEQAGYSTGYMSVLLRRRAKEVNLLDLWQATVKPGRYVRTH